MSSSAVLRRALLALAVVALALWTALTTSPRLGLDLRGGTRIVLETQDAPGVRADAQATDRALEVLRKRVDGLGVAEPSLARSGENRIVVELPGLRDPREAAEVIGRTAQLTIHAVTGPSGGPAREPAADGGRVLADPDAAPGSAGFLALAAPALTGDGVKSADAVLDATGGRGWTVDLAFRDAAAADWARLTGEAACAPAGDHARRVAIVLDGRIVSAPSMQTGVPCGGGIAGGATQITGGFSAQEARDLAALVEGGALPVPVTTVEQSTVGPTLGAEAIRASALAAVIGLACTGAFVIAVYRLLGLLATIALLLYGLISYAAVVALGATLTLPGLAGFVLAVGIAVDANVLVFERAREEYAALGRSAPDRDPRRPLAAAFGKAWSAVADSNVTTLLAAGLLFAFATGPVKGFGVTLAIGVLASMVTAMVITRLLADAALALPAVRRRPAVTGMAGLGRLRTRLNRRAPRLMVHRRRWFTVSTALLLVALAGIGVRGVELGVEFTGGRDVRYAATRPVDADAARAAVAAAGFPDAVVQTTGDGGRDVTVRVGETGDEAHARITEAVTGAAGPVTVERDDLIGPSLGGELRTHALLALGLAVAAQLVYLSVRFRWTYAAAAVAAMAQDVLLVVGLFAWLGKPVDSVFLAALLTVVGYSVNDSVVVLDRLRELRRKGGGLPLADLADRAVAQTLPRTVNTGMGALFVLAALAVLGGDTLTDFSVALLAGVLLGMASTVFTALPLTVTLETRSPAPTRPAAPRPASADRTGAVV
ncbi:protein translocase subunit SecDF [Streptomyces omiyaensis]|uniref:protein translocase subunit SecD n=1 Tax=Streptomyces omiyaensis TaxID=68247 RepID=UPI001672A924|nr:protein translocase subunit SecD [Streptomyces omiyaensis]GGY58375.1 protein translocase subunit SecDF [Streptomyces omiyaensis]